jgi:hypothetical protein
MTTTPAATPESLNPRKPPDGRHPPPRKKQYFTFEQVGDRAHKNAAFEPTWLLSRRSFDQFLKAVARRWSISIPVPDKADLI